MRVCIIGAGALGSTIGATLSEGGGERMSVSLVDPFRAHVDAIAEHGLVVRTGDGPRADDRVVSVDARTSCDGLGVVDVVIVLVKSFVTRAAVEGARSLIGPDTVVITLQNGLGNEETIAEVVGGQHVLNGTTYVGGRLIGPGHVSSGVIGRKTIIGEFDGQMSARVTRIAQEFTAAGLETTATHDIQGIKWDKLLVNVSTAALSTITGLEYGDLYAVPEIEECAVAAIREGMAVAQALGITLTQTDPSSVWRSAAKDLPRDFKTSMLQSVEAGSRTEIDVINGSIVRWGERTGVPTPVNTTLVAGVKGIEAKLRGAAR